MRRFLPVLAVFLLLFTAAGCTSDDSPTAPNDPNDPTTPGGDGGDDEDILTPRSVRIEGVQLRDFPERKGSVTWDASLSVAPRRPDVFVTLKSGSASSDPFFESIVEDDAFANVSYDMSDEGSGNALPTTVTAGQDIAITILDDDGVFDDTMSEFSVDPLDQYDDDNAASFSWTLRERDGEGEVRVWGDWVY